MSGEFSASWLGLREPADAAARAADLVPLIPGPVRSVRDLGCGTGSLGRWLAPKLPVPQRWVMTDLDPALLEHAKANMPFDGVTVETVLGDVTALTSQDLTGTDLVTCSALLDLLTAEEVASLAEACAGAGTTALFTLSVAGEVTFTPELPGDETAQDAFNEHQRRVSGERRLLGPDAPWVAREAFERVGARVVTRESPWVLGTGELASQWLGGWLHAAREQRPDHDWGTYPERRAATLDRVTVGHIDLLATFV